MVTAISAPAQEIDRVFVIQAAFINQFTQLTEWPANAITGDVFVIGIIGKSDMQQALEALARDNVKMKGKRINIRVIEQLSEVDGCQLLFIAGSEKSRLSDILNAVKNKPILTIGDTKGFAKNGVMINLGNRGETVQFMVNPRSATDAGLRFSENLLKLAEIVE
jgi:hypothetical protein